MERHHGLIAAEASARAWKESSNGRSHDRANPGSLTFSGNWHLADQNQGATLGAGFLIKHVRMFLLAIRGFDEDKCQLRASALTYYTLLSLVPIAAMAFGVAKGFGFEDKLEDSIYRQVSSEEQVKVVDQVIEFARGMLDNTSGGLIAGIGVAVLFWTIIRVLGNIEKSFNDIWGIKAHRSIGRKLGDYLSVMLIGPVLMIASSSVNVFIETRAQQLADQDSLIAASGEVVLFGLRFWPYLLIWALFAFVYAFMPNGKIKISSSILGEFWQGRFISSCNGVTSNARSLFPVTMRSTEVSQPCRFF